MIIRTLDIGADKQVEYFNLGKEENPALGYRAIRSCLKEPEILKAQLRALFRAAVYGNLSVMYPMITSTEEVEKIYAIVAEVEEELKKQEVQYKIPEQGIMIETPAAVMMSRELAKEVDFLQRLKAYLEEGNLAIGFELQDEDEEAWFAEYNLLTAKPVIYAANVSEDDLADDGASNAYVQAVRDFAAKNGSEVFVICAQIEQEISELDEDERKMFLEDLGLKESGLEKLIKASYSLLGLISYLTAGETETRAWTIKKGTKAPQAAGKIHSDFERGFIRAEVVNYQDLLDCGSYSAAKEKGLVGLEGKDYVVKDGDVVLFRFNV